MQRLPQHHRTVLGEFEKLVRTKRQQPRRFHFRESESQAGRNLICAERVLPQCQGQEALFRRLDTQGIEFPYPAYLQNIAREVIHQFQTQATRLTLVADVALMIRRDGTIDPNSLRIVKASGNYAFDQHALGAVEAAGNTKRFGPLPAGFREDILPVVFRFTPALR